MLHIDIVTQGTKLHLKIHIGDFGISDMSSGALFLLI